MFSLRTMVWLVVLLALLPLLVLSFVTAGHVRRASIAHYEDATLELVEDVSHEQEHLLDVARLRVQLLAGIPVLREATSDPAGCALQLSQAAGEAGPGYSFLLVDPNGDPICGSLEANANFSDRSWFRRPLERGGFAAGDYIVSRISDEALIVLGMPVTLADGGTGVLGHGVNLEWLTQIFTEAELSEYISLAVVDGDGKVLAGFPTSNGGEPIADREAFEAAASGVAGRLERGRSVTVFQRLNDEIDNVFVIATASTEGAYRQANLFLLRNLGGLLLIAALLATLLRVLAGASLVRPLERLVDSYAAIETGDLEVRLPSAAPLQELTTVAQGFNRMTEALAERSRELRERAAYTRLLYTITSQVTDDIEQRLEAALELTAELLGLDVAAISNIEGEHYRIEHVYPRDGQLRRGQQLELGSTFCSLVAFDGSVAAFHHVGASELSGHPCYLAHGLESYIGVRLFAAGKPFGTLSFSSTTARREPFSQIECEFVGLLARWVGSALERRRLDGELASSEMRYRSVVNSLAEGVIVRDRSGTIIEANTSALDILGIEPERIVGRTFAGERPAHRGTEPLSPEGYATLIAQSPGAPMSDEVVMLRRDDGGNAWLLVNTRPLECDPDGTPSTVVASFLDISERIRVEQAVAAEKRRFQAIFDSAFQFIGLLQPDGILLEVNRTALEFAGIEADEVRGKPLWEGPWWSISSEIRAELRAAVARASAGEFVRYNVDIIGAGNRVSTVDFSLKPVHDEQGRVVLLVPEGRVIDEMIQTQLQLEQNSRALERSNRELQQFAYVASHDLKEPLRAISGYVGLLERRYAADLDDDGRQFIAYAVDASTRMAALIDALLAFSRAGSSVLKTTEVSLGEVIESVERSLSYSLADAGAELSVGSLPVLLADEVQMVQLFQNLLANAIKFRGEEAPRIRVSAELLADAWRVSVRDNGIGIEPSYRERIFTIFQRLHPHDIYEGTGIGLALCKRIVERHGATIGVESIAGRGSCFFVDFPVGMVRHGSEADRDLVG